MLHTRTGIVLQIECLDLRNGSLASLACRIGLLALTAAFFVLLVFQRSLSATTSASHVITSVSILLVDARPMLIIENGLALLDVLDLHIEGITRLGI